MVDFLFYDIPLDKGTNAIHEFIKTNPNFKVLTTDTLFWQIRNVSTKIKKVNDLTKNADSAFIDLSPTWTTMCNGKKMRAMTLTSISLTMYFKTPQLRNIEFDTLNKILNKKYHFMYNTWTGKQDSAHESGYEFRLTRKIYPQLKLMKDTLKNETPYLTVTYFGRD